ncbi:hypothetical protein BJP41_06045 [Candidatus Williamhamiltonella defendens]|uniref:Uncharacterized protein n=1 Tax=Candidatus Williamhamiltonella defendens TaxID=138072 RepID=A0A2D3SX77_9ENTR|nr:hypothetical protein [Candidatus Hamiltonella defensa]ATW22555.1 hypothetical protein BJP44_05595 [Candidatus Hamiltonella defensa]ATW29959.1 hypothetical protein BJP41_06045 [Candidatus Hamiltonella defensa]ATW31933.1 hypothetical protein BJP42_06140 [Candidatus Hamiltonella defensa]
MVLCHIRHDELEAITEGEDIVLKMSRPGFKNSFSVTIKKGAKLNTAQKIEKIQTLIQEKNGIQLTISDLEFKKTLSFNTEQAFQTAEREKLKNIQMSNGDDITPDLITTLMSAFNSKDKTPIIQEIASTFYKPIAQIVTQ